MTPRERQHWNHTAALNWARNAPVPPRDHDCAIQGGDQSFTVTLHDRSQRFTNCATEADALNALARCYNWGTVNDRRALDPALVVNGEPVADVMARLLRPARELAA